jgi:hypothetical protein
MLTDVDIGSGSVWSAKDYVGVDYHNEGHSQIDACCHVAYDGMLYGGIPDAEVTSRGAVAGAIDLLADGPVGRWVLLDIPGIRGVRWLEPASTCFADDLDAAERAQGVSVEAGDASSSAPDTCTVSPSLRRGTRASATPACTRARPDSSQADASPHSGPMETTTGPRAPPKRLRTRSTSSRSRPWDPPARRPAVRGPRPVVRGGPVVDVPRRRLTAANRGRDRFAGQPDRDPLIRFHLQRRSSRRGPRAGRKTGSHVRIDEHGDHASRGVTRSRSLPAE